MLRRYRGQYQILSSRTVMHLLTGARAKTFRCPEVFRQYERPPGQGAADPGEGKMVRRNTDGNLFPKGGSGGARKSTRMGCRNPFRISIDQRNGTLYWGDVQYRCQQTQNRRKCQYDEVNRAPVRLFRLVPIRRQQQALSPIRFLLLLPANLSRQVAVNRSPFNTGQILCRLRSRHSSGIPAWRREIPGNRQG